MTVEEFLKSKEPNTYTIPSEWLSEFADIKLKEYIDSKESEVEEEPLSSYFSTYKGKELLETYGLYKEGVWVIRGEDPNCDLGGYHSNPYLCTVAGTLKQAVEYAEALSGFYIWGAGGVITLKSDNIIQL